MAAKNSLRNFPKNTDLNIFQEINDALSIINDCLRRLQKNVLVLNHPVYICYYN